jgi:hypothetical protein
VLRCSFGLPRDVLRTRAQAAGASVAQLEAAAGSDNPTEALAELLMALEAAPEQRRAAAAAGPAPGPSSGVGSVVLPGAAP